MKTNFFGKCAWGTTIVILCLAGGPLLPAVNVQDQSTPTPGDATLPANISPDSPLAQVIRLAQAGVDESVILTYITNSTSPFNLTSDDIIYLKDLGLPDDAVTAMMQRDLQLGATATVPPASDTNVVVTSEPPSEVTQNYFYDTLSPYGNWVDIDGYGLCWQPVVVIYDSNWQPYCDHGHWVYTDSGWYWLSDYSWGATTFHYGRWFHDPRHGWCWWPDTVWAPSWVTWRYGNGYCGWAPLPPHAVYREGVGFFYNGVAVSAGFNFGLAANFFTFVPTGDFCDPHPHRVRIGLQQVTQIYNHTTIINDFRVDNQNHTIINGGIPTRDITAVTRTDIHPVAIHEVTTPVSRGEQLGRNGQALVINRPHFNADAATTLNNGTRPHLVTVVHPTTPSPAIYHGNQNNSISQPQTPAQPRFTQTPRGNEPNTQNQIGAPIQRPNYYSPPAQTPNSTYDPDKRIYSPRQQQLQQQTPNFSPRNTGGITPTAPTTQPTAPPPSFPQQTGHYSPPVVEHPQNNDTHQTYSPPAERPNYNESRQNNSSAPERTQNIDTHQDYSPPSNNNNNNNNNNSSSSSQQSNQRDGGNGRH
ncbi:MAG TPA: DUF6600 domain-containing protein [Verrucomicrobiae bacterium]|nr:DUF6600 domain-containing protein [Verrucomicrobiae bacterium]